MISIDKIGLGGGCHWCTEGVFQSLIGVERVEQGWIASEDENKTFSEGVIVHFNPKLISLKELLEIHIYTHSSSSNHSMRKKYRSAIYVFSRIQLNKAEKCLNEIQKGVHEKLITKVLTFSLFRLNDERFLNYFYKQPERSFCTTYIHPKIRMLMNKFSHLTDPKKMDKLIAKKH